MLLTLNDSMSILVHFVYYLHSALCTLWVSLNFTLLCVVHPYRLMSFWAVFRLLVYYVGWCRVFLHEMCEGGLDWLPLYLDSVVESLRRFLSFFIQFQLVFWYVNSTQTVADGIIWILVQNLLQLWKHIHKCFLICLTSSDKASARWKSSAMLFKSPSAIHIIAHDWPLISFSPIFFHSNSFELKIAFFSRLKRCSHSLDYWTLLAGDFSSQTFWKFNFFA